MASEIKEICSYLRDVLNFRNYIEIPDDENNYFSISNEELQAGKIMNDDRRNYLHRWWQQKMSSHTGDTSSNEDDEVDILLIPKIVCDVVPRYGSTICLNKDNGWEYKKISLLYIKAKCNLRTLEITPAQGENLIWSEPIIKKHIANPISRLIWNLIEKFQNKNDDRIARFELKQAPAISNIDDWKMYISTVAGIFKIRTDKEFFAADSLTDEHGVAHTLYDGALYGRTIVMKDDTVFATKHIVDMLSHIIGHTHTPMPLLRSMLISPNSGKTLVKSSVGQNIAAHLGQMKNDYPLADAQRDAVHSLSTLETGKVLAVSGPPGTGKTTMLQSIVADLLVRTTLNGKKLFKSDSAPLILATSANNKAITNIIDAFSSSNKDVTESALDTRWICYDADGIEKFVPMAAYFPSSMVSLSKTKDYFTTDSNGGRNYGALRKRYFKDSSDFYIRANQALGSDHDCVDAVMADLSGRMDACRNQLDKFASMMTTNRCSHSAINNIIHAISDQYGHSDKVNKIIDDYYKNSSKYESAGTQFIDRILDLTVRYELYWLAVHYNECQWIKRLEAHRFASNYLKNVYGKFLFDEIKFICPCIVSTFFRAPKLFEFKHKDGLRNYNYILVDLLIVDEAGQVSPEIGLPTFALAKRAVVVGDTKQIPPVHSVPKTTDDTYWKRNVRSKRLHSQRNLLSCSKSSIMAIAETHCQYERISAQGIKKSGLFLNEHRRCVDEIIDYSNQLIYGGELMPKRGPAEDHCTLKNLPPMAIYLNESPSKIKDGSRFNEGEVEKIRNWIRANESDILKAYSTSDRPKDITELINIITPFKAQSSLIRQDSYLSKFPIGTVHTFQGAESPIVIFSMVYGPTDNPVFIKSNHELMNVAVSRAKDHFILIGSRTCIDRNKDDEACRLLYTKLKVINS